MKVLIAIDSFKGSLTSLEAGYAISKGLKNANKKNTSKVFALADGGEGTVDALTTSMNGKIVKVKVTGPLGNKINSYYGIKNKTAIIECANVCGLPQVPKEKRNVLNTTSFGMGEIILDAIKNGCNKFIIGLGGSATNDGGIGMLMALGYKFFDTKNKLIPLGAKALLNPINKIDISNANKKLNKCEFLIASDVNNPLSGKMGATYVFGPQKGIDKKYMPIVDKNMKLYGLKSAKVLHKKDDEINNKGAGAAGGLGFAFMTYLNAKMKPGIEVVIKEANIEKEMKNVDVVVTGEGRLDAQTMMGKAPSGIANLAKKYNKKVIAFAGCLSKDAKELNAKGIDAYFAILDKPMSLDEAMDKKIASENLANTAEQVFRLLDIRSK